MGKIKSKITMLTDAHLEKLSDQNLLAHFKSARLTFILFRDALVENAQDETYIVQFPVKFAEQAEQNKQNHLYLLKIKAQLDKRGHIERKAKFNKKKGK